MLIMISYSFCSFASVICKTTESSWASFTTLGWEIEKRTLKRTLKAGFTISCEWLIEWTFYDIGWICHCCKHICKSLILIWYDEIADTCVGIKFLMHSKTASQGYEDTTKEYLSYCHKFYSILFIIKYQLIIW